MKTVARSSDGQMIRWCLLGGDETSVGEEERREGEDKSRAPALRWQVLDRNWSQNSGRQWKTARMGGWLASSSPYAFSNKPTLRNPVLPHTGTRLSSTRVTRTCAPAFLYQWQFPAPQRYPEKRRLSWKLQNSLGVCTRQLAACWSTCKNEVRDRLTAFWTEKRNFFAFSRHLLFYLFIHFLLLF